MQEVHRTKGIQMKLLLAECDEQHMLLNEEARAWRAYKDLRDSGTQDNKEIVKRADNAGMATSRLRDHLFSCRNCRARLANERYLSYGATA
jgi:hypothetical protein